MSTQGRGSKSRSGPQYVRQIPDFLKKYSHLLGEHEQAPSMAANLTELLGDDPGDLPDVPDWTEELEGATVAEDLSGLRPALEAESAATVARAKSRGNEAFAAGKHEEAITFFSQAITLAPQDAVLYSNRSAAYAGVKSYADAERDAKRTIELRPRWSKSYSRLGVALMGQSMFEEARAAYKKGMEVDPLNQLLMDGFHMAQRKLSELEGEENLTGKHSFKGRKRREVREGRNDESKGKLKLSKRTLEKNLVSFYEDEG